MTQMRSSQLKSYYNPGDELTCSYDEQELEAQDVGEEEGMNEANVDETMIVVGLMLIRVTDRPGVKSTRRRREATYGKSSQTKRDACDDTVHDEI